MDNTRYLKVPEFEKNLLISPPGSPPVGWVQSREDRPNSTTLSDDLVHALAKFHSNSSNNIYDDFEEFTLDDKIESESRDSHNDSDSRNNGPILTIMSSDVDVDNNTKYENKPDVPLILIQNWDDPPPSSTKTKKPNLQIYNNDKAQLRPNITHRPITRTPRPPFLSSQI
ncbi:Calcipressin-domain-containing protein [Gigaspora margarita]|uniref:Calcipressin-domain-containing protein n=1 Tax=Gigaspora margarita TaxID=4874 RepID=A0A8H4EU78_GIGMA|nr:Calcipressin-domain-containing protein [Gigaspora margarita]